MKEKLLAGHYYHIYNRGNNGENIFKEHANYRYFLQNYARHCYPVLNTYAYCLLKNHFHLLVRVREPGEMIGLMERDKIDEKVKQRLCKNEWSPQVVSQQLSHLFNGYTQAINKRHTRTGSLFERPFERKIIDEDSYFCNVTCYIHQNPQRHGFVDDFRSYRYSSYWAYLSKRKSRIYKEETLERFGAMENFKAAHVERVRLPQEYDFD